MRPIVKHLIPPSLCSLQSFIAVLVLLYVYLTLQNSVSLHEKIVTTQKKSSTSTSFNNLSPPTITTLPYQPPLITTTTYTQPSSPPPPSPPPPSLQSLVAAATGNFYKDFNITWGGDRGKITNNGRDLTLSLDPSSGSGFRSIKQYIFVKIDIDMKLIPNNSAGTATTYYLTSHGPKHDEIDFEFLGNLSGQPYTLHTNVYCKGIGDKEQQFHLWFDPTADYHTYSILWNPKSILFYVDGIPIREFKNIEKSAGVPYPKKKPMNIYSSLWNADDWATQGGRVKIDWSLAPFVASYRNFKAKGCVWLADLGASSCDDEFRSYLDRDEEDRSWLDEELDDEGRQKMEAVRNQHMTYDYCKDERRFPNGLPKECVVQATPLNLG